MCHHPITPGWLPQWVLTCAVYNGPNFPAMSVIKLFWPIVVSLDWAFNLVSRHWTKLDIFKPFIRNRIVCREIGFPQLGQMCKIILSFKHLTPFVIKYRRKVCPITFIVTVPQGRDHSVVMGCQWSRGGQISPQAYTCKRRILIQVLPVQCVYKSANACIHYEYMYHQIWYTHWAQEVREWVYAFWKCKPVSQCKEILGSRI